MKLSAHFLLDELVGSQIAARLGIKNEPSAAEIENLKALCADILEPLRNSVGRPIFVTSGYRSLALNAAVNGANPSDHTLGLAADIVSPPLSVDNLARAVKALAPYVPLKQCIVEFPERGGGWVHVSRLPVGVEARPPQFLVASLNSRGKTVYSPWEA